jgi:hypothetical protein
LTLPSCHELLRSAIVETGSGSVVELFGDVVKVPVGDGVEVGSLGEVLAEQAVGVLVAAALPGRVRVGEEDA